MKDVLRKTAIRRYVLGGESPKAIYNSLNRSKKWFFKWLKRYQAGGMDWYKDKGDLRLLPKKAANVDSAVDSVVDARNRKKNDFLRPGASLYKAPASKRRMSCLDIFSSTL
jgi:putative transposase